MLFSKLLTFVLFGFGLTSYSYKRFIDYYHVDQPKTWTDAQKYCREKYTDLLSIESNDDLRLMNSVSVPTTWSWIGLHDDPKSWKGVMGKDENSWRWSATSETSENGFQNWAPTEPNNLGSNQHCVRISPEGEWIDMRCTERFQFVCYNDTNPPGQKTYTLIPILASWKEAQDYCRTYFKDLAMIEDAEENTNVMSLLSNVRVWIGLYRNPWRWSDRSNSSFRNWVVLEPDNFGGQHCVAENSVRYWADRNCDIKRFFWCYKDLTVKRIHTVSMKFLTSADLSDPDINIQILQQLSERLNISDSNVTLKWKTEPRKLDKETDEPNR
ncbi:macrophage mannose receptor 1-like [Echeneis naucrates]|uniref:macrophage mannose receptor 1-like n=1 Tax=Echeneis naucrates TaxID=173247 RepID=UPI0011142216|nr:macrophage mannose receptor 1-like [Echeneis naucrates]